MVGIEVYFFFRVGGGGGGSSPNISRHTNDICAKKGVFLQYIHEEYRGGRHRKNTNAG